MVKITCAFILLFLMSCYNVDINKKDDSIPASWGKYKIESVANEILLQKQYPESNTSDCGLSNDDFIKYAMKRIDHKREFQFIVFVDGKPMVGTKCLRRALIFYLK